jgi:hypothetical protein
MNNNYVPESFNMSIWDVMVENGAIQFWIVLCIGLLIIMTFVMLLDSKKFGPSIQRFIDRPKKKVVKVRPLKKGGKHGK